MQPIEATNVAVEQPEVPRCELWDILVLEDGAWVPHALGPFFDRDEFDRAASGLRLGTHFRTFHFTDAPPAPVDEAAVAAMFDAFDNDLSSTFSNSEVVAAFVAELVANGVPRLEGK